MHARLAVLLLALLLALPVAVAASPGPATTPPTGSGGSNNGTLVVVVTPALSTVLVNGTAVATGASGTASVTLPAGTYLVTVSAPGYAEFMGNVTVTTAQTEYLTVHLVSAPPSSGGSGLKLSSFTVGLVVTIVGVVAVAGLAIFLWRRKTAPETTEPPAAESKPGEEPE